MDLHNLFPDDVQGSNIHHLFSTREKCLPVVGVKWNTTPLEEKILAYLTQELEFLK